MVTIEAAQVGVALRRFDGEELQPISVSLMLIDDLDTTNGSERALIGSHTIAEGTRFIANALPHVEEGIGALKLGFRSPSFGPFRARRAIPP